MTLGKDVRRPTPMIAPPLAPTFEPGRMSATPSVDGAPLSGGYPTSTLGAKPRRIPANVGANVIRQAGALVSAYTTAALDERVAAYREAFVGRASSPMFRAALFRAMDGESRSTIGGAPEGLPWSAIVQHAQELSAGEAAATTFTTRFWAHSTIWCEAYVATYVARNGARAFASQLANSGGSDPMLAGALGWAQRDGLISATDAQTLAAVNTQLDAGSASSLAEPLGDARDRYERAKAELDALEAELRLELTEVGAALDNPAEYIERFRSTDEYKATRTEAEEAANALGIELGIVNDDLEARGRATTDAGTSSRTALLDSYDALAGSPRALDAVVWAQANLTAPSFTESERLRIQQISAKAQATDAAVRATDIAKILEDSPDDKRNALRRVLAYLDQHVCEPYSQIDSLVGVRELRGYIADIRRNAGIVHALRSDGAAAALDVAMQAPRGASPIVTRSWSTLTAVVSTLGDLNAVANPSNVAAMGTAAHRIHEHLVMLREVASAAGAGDHAAERQAADLVRRVARGYDSLSSLGFGTLALASDLIALQQNVDRLRQFPDNVAIGIECAAQIAAVIGGVLCLCPPLAPVGMLISASAAAIGTIAGFFVGDPEGDRRRSNERARLEGVLGDAALADTFAKPASASNLRAAQTAGLAPDAIHDLARGRPWLFAETDGYIGRIDALRRWLAAHPEDGEFVGAAPTLYELLSTLDRDALDGLDYFGVFVEGGSFEADTYLYLGEIESILPTYRRR